MMYFTVVAVSYGYRVKVRVWLWPVHFYPPWEPSLAHTDKCWCQMFLKFNITLHWIPFLRWNSTIDRNVCAPSQLQFKGLTRSKFAKGRPLHYMQWDGSYPPTTWDYCKKNKLMMRRSPATWCSWPFLCALCPMRPMKVELHRSTVSTDGFHWKSIIEIQFKQ